MSMKINRLEIENVKRIKAVKLEPAQNGLTIIGGDNQQGKTSVLDSIAWALGGERYKPSQSTREGSMVPPNLHIVMNNGLVVERKGKNSALKVTDPNGQKAGQQLLNEFVEQLALDLPKFMEASGTEKAKVLLQIIGVGPQLAELEQEEKELYQERLYVGRTADQKEKFAKEQPYYPDAPMDLVSPSELIRQQQDILARNGENQRKRGTQTTCPHLIWFSSNISSRGFLQNFQISRVCRTVISTFSRIQRKWSRCTKTVVRASQIEVSNPAVTRIKARRPSRSSQQARKAMVQMTGRRVPAIQAEMTVGPSSK